MFTFLKDLISGLAAWLRITDRRQAQMDDPAIKANAQAKTNAEIRDTANTAVREDDLERIRRMAAE